ncbi:GNAT family N-acetyltransferase [Saccharopolyspora sp. SCSIO 74807]|uniref:GNAT family N-acetyltransferase n=1 Tax=Saccharopolyspora sp. SCSIO 74807 TaxID=3118084 RepID=UPI0030CFF057
MDIRTSRYEPSARSAVVEFQQLLWSGGPDGNAAYLDWKYAQNPYLNDRYLLLAWEGDELVGMVGGFGACWQHGGDRVVLPCIADTVVAPDHRGGPLFGRMLDELTGMLRADGVPWLLDFGDQRAAPIMVMQGWQSVGPWAIATAERSDGAATGRLWAQARERELRAPRSGARIRTTATPEADLFREFGALAERNARATHIRHVRDAEYLSWRARNPLADYFYLTAHSDGLAGYLVGHRTRVDATDGHTPTTIVECEAVDDGVWLDLVEAAAGVLPGTTVLIWTRDIGADQRSSLPSLGFAHDEPSGRLTRDWHLPNLLVRSTGAEVHPDWLTGLHDPSRWDLRAVCGRSWR